MVRDNIGTSKWFWDVDPWRNEFHQLRLRVENGRWTDITLREGELSRDGNGMRLDDEYPELYTDFAFSMLITEYLSSADGVEYASGQGSEPEKAFAPPTTKEIARSYGGLSDKSIKLIRKWWKRGVAVIAIITAYLLFRDAPWDQFISWYMENFGGGLPAP